MGRLDGKVAPATGSAQGIGKAIARKFAQYGARVVIGDTTHDRAMPPAATARLEKAIARQPI